MLWLLWLHDISIEASLMLMLMLMLVLVLALQDNEIMEQIDRDVMRTHPDMHFFSGDSADAEQHRREMKR
jgi:predicted lysophospholipase L1 biosynthesis ABC-type transport system permease subunit